MSIGIALAAALLCSLPMLCQCQCPLQLEVTNSSTLTFSGAATQPVQQPVTLEDNPTLSLNGNIVLQLPGACPSSASSLLAGLQSSTIQAQSGNQLALLPTDLSATVRPFPCMDGMLFPVTTAR